jgi:hypothetical protein
MIEHTDRDIVELRLALVDRILDRRAIKKCMQEYIHQIAFGAVHPFDDVVDECVTWFTEPEP